MSPEIHRLYAFRDFRLDLTETVLLRQGKEVPITPKAFQLLSILVENHGAVVRKEKLMSEIWADSFVEDGNLAFTARLLRQALGDNARTPIYVETIPRKGYRFIADVTEPPSTEESQPVTTSAVADPRIPQRLKLLTMAWGLVIFILATVSWFSLDRYGFRSESAPVFAASFKAERLSSTGNAVHAAISPNGRLIAYTDQTGDGKWSIWLRQVSTAENIQIVTPADVMYGGLAFSRDNNSIFLVRGELGTKRLDVYRVNVFGGVLTKLIENTQGWISISPDDTKISFVRCEYNVNDYCSLFVADIDGRNERRIVTRSQPIRIADNQFSTDGRSIAFASGQSRTGSNQFGLFQVELATGVERAITSEKFFNIKYLRWLPSGDGLLVTARPHVQPKFSIWKVSVATGAVAQLTREDSNFSGLSLDGEARNLIVTKVDNDFAIYIDDISDRSARRLLAAGANCVFTPDGKVVYESKDQNIWIVEADGANKRQLTNDAGWDINPIVTADGRRIVFSSNRSGVNHLWRMNIDGSDQKQLTQTEGGYAQFVTPDSRWVYYRAGINGALRKVNTEDHSEFEVTEIDGSAPAFSPSGDTIASFVRDPENGNLNISVRELGGRSLVRSIDGVGDNKSDPVRLDWTGDGQTLNYVIRRAGEYELWTYRMEGEKRLLLANLGSQPLERVNIAPDGRSIASVSGNWLHDSFLVTGLKF